MYFSKGSKKTFLTFLFIDVDYKGREPLHPYALQQWLFLFGIGPNKYENIGLGFHIT
jgi:hypothetical protein